MNLPDKSRMYVITRGEFSETYRAVQGAHALAQYALNHRSNFIQWNNEYLIFLKTFLPAGIGYIWSKLQAEGIKTSEFHEPDLDFQMTAICVFYDVDNKEEAEKIFKILGKLPLA
jgi:hypothetical protein